MLTRSFSSSGSWFSAYWLYPTDLSTCTGHEKQQTCTHTRTRNTHTHTEEWHERWYCTDARNMLCCSPGAMDYFCPGQSENCRLYKMLNDTLTPFHTHIHTQGTAIQYRGNAVSDKKGVQLLPKRCLIMQIQGGERPTHDLPWVGCLCVEFCRPFPAVRHQSTKPEYFWTAGKAAESGGNLLNTG